MRSTTQQRQPLAPGEPTNEELTEAIRLEGLLTGLLEDLAGAEVVLRGAIDADPREAPTGSGSTTPATTRPWPRLTAASDGATNGSEHEAQESVVSNADQQQEGGAAGEQESGPSGPEYSSDYDEHEQQREQGHEDEEDDEEAHEAAYEAELQRAIEESLLTYDRSTATDDARHGGGTHA